MFGKKKTAAPVTPVDNHWKNLCGQINDANNVLLSRARNVITVQGAASLYPDGPDKNAALEEVDKAKHALLCAIGTYDGLVAEATRYRQSHEVSSIRQFTPSHKIIEVAYWGYFNA